MRWHCGAAKIATGHCQQEEIFLGREEREHAPRVLRTTATATRSATVYHSVDWYCCVLWDDQGTSRNIIQMNASGTSFDGRSLGVSYLQLSAL